MRALALILALAALVFATSKATADDDPLPEAPAWSDPADARPPAQESSETTPEAAHDAAVDAMPIGRRPPTTGQGGEAPEPPPAAKPFVMPTTSTVVAVTKHHNQPWFGNWLALELEMKLAIVGQRGKRVGASVTFYEAESGRPLRAVMEPYLDATGNVSVYTQAVPIDADSGLFDSRLKIPYRAFPWPTSAPAYPVEARVRLMRLEDDGTVTVLDEGVTQFTVQYQHGCGVASNENPCPMGRGSANMRNFRYDWHKLWDDCMGRNPLHSGLPPPKGPGRARPQWYEAKWRTRAGCRNEPR